MKPYNSLSDHLKERFGTKTVKLSVNAGFTCPNRDGKISKGGCIFCSGAGSGQILPRLPICQYQSAGIIKATLVSKMA